MRKRYWLIGLFFLIGFLVFFFIKAEPMPTRSPSIENSATFERMFYADSELMQYPKIQGIDADIAEKINGILFHAAEKSYKKYLAVKAAEKKLTKEQLCKKTVRCKYSFNSLYQVMYNANDKVSIYYSEYTYTGGSKGSSKITMYNFNLLTGKSYTISDIFNSASDYSNVRKYAYNYLRTHKPYAQSVKKLSDVTINKKTRFIFADNGIYIFFTNYKQYEPSSYDDGDPYINIPKHIYQ